ncbi:uncharacterized protein LOC106468932 [Limulus polyphemus]|uniref:Uncharacterized protein LOC106468932 n=1 Tax=Limulus polyphemus TaxID=6850 RepID=A0ABM1BM80_LIMPO|nr:uncharacterized protein LOC106468932 [Limulus polyphemus]
MNVESGAEDSLKIPSITSDFELEAPNITFKNFTVEFNNHKLAAKVSSAPSIEESGSENESVLERFFRQPLHGDVDNQGWGGSLRTQARGSLSAYRPEFPNITPFDFSSRYSMNMIRVNYITADCYDNYMRINLHFNGTFSGIVYSTGYVHDPDCVYINGSFEKRYEFYIRLNRCGTLGQRKGDYNTYFEEDKKHSNEYMWNTITVQYNSVIEEEWDENFRVTCEYGYDFRKTVTFPLANVEVNTGNPVVFTLTPPECYMEIKEGFNVRGHQIDGPVSVGDPLTLIIQMKSENS